MRIIPILAVLLFCFAGSPVSAQVCTFSNTGINFGIVNAQARRSVTATGTVSANCTGTRNSTITICPNIGAGSGGSNATASVRYMSSGTEQIGYNLYQSTGQQQVWGSYVWAFAPRPPTMSVRLSNAGSGSTQQTLNAQMNRANVSPGVFISSFSGANTLFDYGYAPGHNCSVISSRAVQVPFTVQVASLGSCTVTTTPMDFGQLTDLTTVKDTTNTVTVNCSRRTPYTVSLGNGTSGATSPGTRRMTATGTTNTISYGVYTNAARSVLWGVNGFSGRGNGNNQIYTGYGRLPAQGFPDAADYSDTLIVTITY